MRLEHRILPPSLHRLTRQLPPRARTRKPHNLVQIRSPRRLRVPIPSIGKRINVDKLDSSISSADEVQGRAATDRTGSSYDENAERDGWVSQG
jgi:hypothetical protein